MSSKGDHFRLGREEGRRETFAEVRAEIEKYRQESLGKHREWSQDPSNPSSSPDDAAEWAYAALMILNRLDQLERLQ